MINTAILSALALSVLSPIAAAQRLPITGPVINTNFPDPAFIREGNTWYAFGTETENELPRLHVATSTDFIHWTVKPNADGLARMPAWANTTLDANVWAPDVSKLDDGRYLMYFSALLKNATVPGTHCIGYAYSPTALGPYVPGDVPIICPGDVGVIDASHFRERPSGRRYVVWKREDASQDTPLRIAPTTADGSRITEEATTILCNNGASDNFDIEAPLLVKTKATGLYYLFFSPGYFLDNTYSVSYAVASNLLGPYTRKGAVVTHNSTGITAPGHMFVNPEGTLMAFAGVIDHAEPNPNRGMWVAGVSIGNGVVKVG